MIEGGKNLNGGSAGNELVVRKPVQLVLEYQLGSWRVNKGGYYFEAIAISYVTFVVDINLNQWNGMGVIFKIEVGESVFGTEIFTTVFKVFYKMAVPDNSQRVHLVEANGYFFFCG